MNPLTPRGSDDLTWLATRYLRESLRFWGRLAEGLQELSREKVDLQTLVKRGAAFAQDEGRAALRDQLRLQVEYCISAVDVGVGYANRLLQSVFWPQDEAKGAPGGERRG